MLAKSERRDMKAIYGGLHRETKRNKIGGFIIRAKPYLGNGW